MKLSARILRRVAPLEQGGAGPTPRSLLRALARHWGYPEQFEQTMRTLLTTGQLVMIGSKRGARYGLPKRRRA